MSKIITAELVLIGMVIGLTVAVVALSFNLGKLYAEHEFNNTPISYASLNFDRKAEGFLFEVEDK